MEILPILIAVPLGVLMGGLLSLLPSLHIYNVAGLVLLFWQLTPNLFPPEAVAPFFMSLVVSFAFVNTIPMTFIGAPDESATVTILPGTKYMMTGRGYEAAMLTGIGNLAGVVLLAALTPFFYLVFPYIHNIVAVHMHWILGLVMVYMLMSEWPKGVGRGDTVWARIADAWQNLFAGIITFAFSAVLGLIVTSKSIITHEMGFQNIMPVFVGLFAIPSIVQNLLSRERFPEQYVSKSVDLDWVTLGKSTFQGGLGGLLASYLPAVTAGIGGIIAGHATAQRGDKIFIVSGGVSKIIYYVGAFLLLFVITPLTPHGISRGGLSVILKPVFTPLPGQYWVMLASILTAGCLSFLILVYGSILTIAVLKRIDYHKLYWAALVLLIALIYVLTGFGGLFVLAVASCIGSIPVFFHCRRSNCMAVLMVPIALNMAGYGEAVIEFFGLAGV